MCTSKQRSCCPTSGTLINFFIFWLIFWHFRDQNSLDNPENLDLEVLERRVEKLRGQSSTLKFEKLLLIIMVHIPEYEPHSYSVYLAMVIWILKYNSKGGRNYARGCSEENQFLNLHDGINESKFKKSWSLAPKYSKSLAYQNFICSLS